jgi:hypothetical protein
MTDKLRRPGEHRLDFAFGATPRDFEAETAARLADLRRRAAPRQARIASPRGTTGRHVRWRDGVARIHDV